MKRRELLSDPWRRYLYFLPAMELLLIFLHCRLSREEVFQKIIMLFSGLLKMELLPALPARLKWVRGLLHHLPQMMADELNVPYEKVKMVMGDTDLCPYDQGTWGSMTTRIFGPNMRAAAAEARGVLIELASAQAWSSCFTAGSRGWDNYRY